MTSPMMLRKKAHFQDATHMEVLNMLLEVKLMPSMSQKGISTTCIVHHVISCRADAGRDGREGGRETRLHQISDKPGV